MIFRDLSSFADPARDVGLVYFAQRIDELTRSYTLDSYKAPTVTIPVLLKEAIDRLELIAAGAQGVSEKSADPILKELKTRLSGNPIVSRLIARGRDIVETLEGADTRSTIARLNVLESELSSRAYVSTCMSLLTHAVKANSKSDIKFLVREYISVLQSMGMNKRHIHKPLSLISSMINQWSWETTTLRPSSRLYILTITALACALKSAV